MASLIGLNGIRALRNGLVKTSRNSITSRTINMSSKPKQASNGTPTTCSKNNTSVDQSKNWISWGFDEDCKFLDRITSHATFFITISVCIVGGGFVIAYSPDPGMNEWSQREAYLQLRYKEENGLPPIDINYVDPAKITLPTDEELGDTEIII